MARPATPLIERESGASVHDKLRSIREFRLWMAVLVLGIKDALDGRTPADVRWLQKDDFYPGSFAWLCNLAGRDAATTRKKILTER